MFSEQFHQRCVSSISCKSGATAVCHCGTPRRSDRPFIWLHWLHQGLHSIVSCSIIVEDETNLLSNKFGHSGGQSLILNPGFTLVENLSRGTTQENWKLVFCRGRKHILLPFGEEWSLFECRLSDKLDFLSYVCHTNDELTYMVYFCLVLFQQKV